MNEYLLSPGPSEENETSFADFDATANLDKKSDEEKQEIRRALRIDAIARINLALSIEDQSPRYTSVLDELLVVVYGYDEDKIYNTGEKEKQILARALLGQDLMYREMFDDTGAPTLSTEKYYPNLDPKDFAIYGTSWTAIRAEINTSLATVNDGAYDDTAPNPDPIAQYVSAFGAENVVVLPFELAIHTLGVTLAHIKNFQPPYGGSEAERTVYFRILHNSDIVRS